MEFKIFNFLLIPFNQTNSTKNIQAIPNETSVEAAKGCLKKWTAMLVVVLLLAFGVWWLGGKYQLLSDEIETKGTKFFRARFLLSIRTFCYAIYSQDMFRL